MKKFDYVIIGGGSAGCVLANRLSANPRITICLIEAGPDTPPDLVPTSIYDDVHLPDYFQPNRYWPEMKAFKEPIGNQSVAEFTRSHRADRYEQGRVMGGGSSINGQVAARGTPLDYDEWQALGATGWSYEDVLPYFRKLETDLDFDGPYHGKNGPILVHRTFPESWGGFSLAVRDALVERGIPFYQDAHAEFGDGCFPHIRNNYLNRRISAAVAYLDNVTRHRSNLHIIDQATVLEINFDGLTVSGIRFQRAGSEAIETLNAGEVIVAAGVMHSPAILMRCGIGPADHLRELGIPVRAPRGGVGGNLQDHPMCGFGIHIRKNGRLNPLMRNNFPLTVRWSSGLENCGLQDMKLSVSNRFGWSKMGEQMGTILFGPFKSYSKGLVRLRDAGPRTEPIVLLNLLSDERDLERLKFGARFAYGVVTSPAVKETITSAFAGTFGPMMRRLNSRSFLNTHLTGIAAFMLDMSSMSRNVIMSFAASRKFDLDGLFKDDSKLEAWIRDGVMADWHAVGTCRMGAMHDQLAVVDPGARVYGVQRLRVVDASIMPTIPRANTNISTIMLAEKVSESILREMHGGGE